MEKVKPRSQDFGKSKTPFLKKWLLKFLDSHFSFLRNFIFQAFQAYWESDWISDCFHLDPFAKQKHHIGLL